MSEHRAPLRRAADENGLGGRAVNEDGELVSGRPHEQAGAP